MTGRHARKILEILLIGVLILVALDLAKAGLMSVAIDLFAMLDVLGVDLFLFAFFIGLRMVPWWLVVFRLQNGLRRLDPYFFVPTAQQARACPALISHAMPGFVPLVLAVATGTLLAAMFPGTHHTVA